MTLWLGAVAVLVGILIGTVGVGGILLIPALELLTPLSIQASMATALFTFIFTGIVGTLLFQRRGSIDWALTTPLCLGGGPGARVLTPAVALWKGLGVSLPWRKMIVFNELRHSMHGSGSPGAGCRSVLKPFYPVCPVVRRPLTRMRARHDPLRY